MLVTPLNDQAGITTRLAITDAAQNIPAAILTYNAKPPTALLITCEDANIRFAFGVAPTAALGHILYIGQSIFITNGRSIRDLQLINEAVGVNGVVQITGFYQV